MVTRESMVAHDLRQPVAIILLEADALARMLDRGRLEERKLVEHIRRSATRLDMMINDLLDVSQIDARRLALERAETDLAALLDDAVERLADLVPGHPVRLQVRVRPAPVLIDAARVEQVLGHLVSNDAKIRRAGRRDHD